jgi:hypothetical protein
MFEVVTGGILIHEHYIEQILGARMDKILDTTPSEIKIGRAFPGLYALVEELSHCTVPGVFMTPKWSFESPYGVVEVRDITPSTCRLDVDDTSIYVYTEASSKVRITSNTSEGYLWGLRLLDWLKSQESAK